MKVSALKYTVLSWVSYLAMLIFLMVPFHAFITVWGSTIIGHYTGLRLIEFILLIIATIGVTTLFLIDHKIRITALSRRLVWVILVYVAFNIVWGLLAMAGGEVNDTAFGYAMIVNLRFLVFFLITWFLTLRLARLSANWRWLVMGPALAVVVFGLLQAFVLPHDFLRHFGYGPDTIPVNTTVNSDTDYYRVFSTLRGANPLGAYLLIPISILTVSLVAAKRNWRQAAFLAAALLVLALTYSRSAMIGAVLTIGTILFLSLRSRRAQQMALAAVGALAIVGAVLVLAFQNNPHFQNFVFHTEDDSKVAVSSNQDHVSALQRSLKDIKHEPLGRGPGTAGPASVYNDDKPVRIAENYYAQIGQETGLIGLALFLLILAGVGHLLWLRRASPLALALLASLIGLSFVNLLWHAWTDDTIAYVWWGLAGIAVALPPVMAKTHQKTSEAKDAKKSAPAR